MGRDGGDYGCIRGHMGLYGRNFERICSSKTKTILSWLYYPHVSDEGDVWGPWVYRLYLVEGWRSELIWYPCHWKKCIQWWQQSLKMYKQKDEDKIKHNKPGIQRISQARWYRLGQSSCWLLHHLIGLHFLKSLRLILKYSSNLSNASGMIDL